MRWPHEVMRLSAQRTLMLFGAVVSTTIALVILVASGLPQRADYTGQIVAGIGLVAPELGAQAPDFELRNIDGVSIRLSDLRGQPVIVNFWATWCGPCIVEMPSLQSLYETQQGSNVRILAVNIGESAQIVRDWQAAHRLTYDLLIDESQSVAMLYRLRGQPSTYVISPAGIITDIFFGPVDEGTMKAVLGY